MVNQESRVSVLLSCFTCDAIAVKVVAGSTTLVVSSVTVVLDCIFLSLCCDTNVVFLLVSLQCHGVYAKELLVMM